MSEHVIMETPAAMSLEAWGALPEDEPGELVDGRLVEEEVVGYAYEIVVVWLAALLRLWVAPRGGLVGGSDARFAVKHPRGRKPDLTVYLPGSPKPPAHGLIRVPPDIAVEVVSPTPRDSRRDRVEKVKEYAAFGVKWYWIVDPQLQSFEVLELGPDQRYAHAFSATEGVIAAVSGAEGLSLDLDALWGELSRLEMGDAGADEDEPEP
jgi:Uma2 family endonuclease